MADITPETIPAVPSTPETPTGAAPAAEAPPETSTGAAPAAEAPPGEMDQASAQPLAAAPPAYPSHEGFAWSDWDGQDLDAFPEPVRGWAEGLSGFYSDKIAKAEKEALKARSTADAFLNGWEDPQVATLTQDLEQKSAALSLAEERYRNLEQHVAAERERQDERYIAWVQETKAADADAAQQALGDEAEAHMTALLEAGYDLHVAIDIGKFGPGAAQDAVKFADRFAGADDSQQLALELLAGRYGVTTGAAPPVASGRAPIPPAAKPAEAPLKESATDSLVAGSSPARVPRTVPVEKTGTKYGDRRDILARIAKKHTRG